MSISAYADTDGDRAELLASEWRRDFITPDNLRPLAYAVVDSLFDGLDLDLDLSSNARTRNEYNRQCDILADSVLTGILGLSDTMISAFLCTYRPTTPCRIPLYEDFVSGNDDGR
jgi:hypothetical protein